jgi:hypothetical protein
MDIRFGDHPSFHRAAAGMVGSSLLFGLALHPITPMAPLLGGLLGTATGAAIAYGRAPWRILAAALAAIPLFVMTPGWTPMIIVASVLSLGLAVGSLRGWKGALAVGLGITMTLVAMWTSLRIGHAQQTATWPGWITAGVAAAAMGMVGVLTMIPRHLSLSIDPVLAAMRRLPATLDPEVRALCTRSTSIWTNAKGQLGDDSGVTLVRDGVLKTLEVAAKSAEVKIMGSTEDELTQRMTDLDTRIAAATDAEVKTQYQAARAALEDQRRYRGHIRQNRERLVARLHNHVAALEKFQLAATGLEAARIATSGSTTVKQLEELSHDVVASSDTLAEIETGEALADVNTTAVSA